MNEEQIEKLEGLKQQMRIKQQKQRLQNNTLLQECLAAIKLYTIIEDEEEIKHIIRLVSLPEVEIYSHDDTIILEDDEDYYIVWDEASLPVLMTSGKSIRENWDDVMAVAFETYFVAVSSEKAIGIRH